MDKSKIHPTPMLDVLEEVGLVQFGFVVVFLKLKRRRAIDPPDNVLLAEDDLVTDVRGRLHAGKIPGRNLPCRQQVEDLLGTL